MSARDRMALVIVAAGALLVGTWFLLVAPERQRAAAAAQSLNQAQSQRDSALAAERAALAAQSGFSANVVRVGLLQRAVPVGQDVSGLLGELEGTGSQQGTAIRSITGGTAAGAGGAGASPAPAAPAPASGPAPAPGAGGAQAAVPAANRASQSAGGTPAPGAGAAPVSAAPSTGAFPAQSFNLTVDGDFLHIQKYLDTIQHWASVNGRSVQVSGRLLNIQSITLATAGSSAGGAQGAPAGGMEGSVVATVYTLPPNDPSTAALLAELRPSATAPVAGAQPALAGAPRGAPAPVAGHRPSNPPVPANARQAHAPTGARRATSAKGGTVPAAAVGVAR